MSKKTPKKRLVGTSAPEIAVIFPDATVFIDYLRMVLESEHSTLTGAEEWQILVELAQRLAGGWMFKDGVLYPPKPAMTLGELNSLAPGGIAKRLDEHRELWALLESESPEFLEEHWWIGGWFESQDEFLSALVERVSAHDAMRPRPDYRKGR